MKLKDVLGLTNDVWMNKISSIPFNCSSCKKEKRISFIVFKYKFDNNFQMQCKFQFYCNDCINSLCKLKHE